MTRRNIDVDKPWHRGIPFAQAVEVDGLAALDTAR